jgi:predicted dehydrogenase
MEDFVIRLGIVGAGSIVQSHIHAAKLCGFSPVVICGRRDSVRAAKIAQENKGLALARDLDELLQSELDAILIAVSTQDAIEVLEKCLEANLPILIEKPVATDPRNLARLNLISTNKVRVGYNRRFYSSVQKFKEELSKVSGLVNIVIPELSLASGTTSNEKKNAVLENSVHVFDLLGYLFGDIKIIRTLKTRDSSDAQFITAQLDLGEQFIGSLNLVFETSENYSIKCWATGNCFEISPIEVFTKSEKMRLIPASDAEPIKRYERVIENWKMNDDDLNAKPGFIGQYREFKSLVNQGSADNLATIQDSIRALNLGIALVDDLYV